MINWYFVLRSSVPKGKKTAGGQYGTPKLDKLSKQKPPEANMGRQNLTNCRKKTAGGQYGTPKVGKLLKKNRRRPIWDAKLTKSWQIVEKKPPEANMRRQKLTISRTNTRRRPKCDTKVTTNKKKHHSNKKQKKIEISMKKKIKYIINHGFSR